MMTVDMFYRDPCILDFLGLQDTYSEKDLENAILAELEKFILEMGTDFAFMSRQKKVTIDGNQKIYKGSRLGSVSFSGQSGKIYHDRRSGCHER